MTANYVHSCDCANEFPTWNLRGSILRLMVLLRERANFHERSSGNQDVNGWTDGRVSLEIYMYISKYIYIYTYTSNRGRNGGNQISGCGISHCNAKFEKLRSEHAHIARERIGPLRYARDVRTLIYNIIQSWRSPI